MGIPTGGYEYVAKEQILLERLDRLGESVLKLKTENEELRLENDKLIAKEYGNLTKEEIDQVRKVLAMFEFYNEMEREDD